MSKLQLRPSLYCSLLVLLIINGAAAAGKTGELTVIWGRNKDEGSLRSTCDTGLYTTVVISFLSVFGHGRYRTDLSGHPLAGVGADIKHCQKAKNVTVLLSIGGAGDQYSLPTHKSAKAVADHLWNFYLGGTSTKSRPFGDAVLDGYSLPTAKSAQDVAEHLWHAYLGGGRRGVSRPFGDAVLDGVDVYVDRGRWGHYDELARRLRSFGREKPAVRLTASPACSLALFDDEVETMKTLSLFERLHVRFYNESSCDYNYFETRPFWGAWRTWTSRFPAARVHVGWPAMEEMSGFVDPQMLRQSVLSSVQDDANYGGVMLWDRYYDKVTGFGHAIKDIV
uniref:GH18 domain-containing protein n=1 Tax=Oryza barthii TaxID=65489 RepID=A0A0D3HQ70_9ORYZ